MHDELKLSPSKDMAVSIADEYLYKGDEERAIDWLRLLQKEYGVTVDNWAIHRKMQKNAVSGKGSSASLWLKLMRDELKITPHVVTLSVMLKLASSSSLDTLSDDDFYNVTELEKVGEVDSSDKDRDLNGQHLFEYLKENSLLTAETFDQLFSICLQTGGTGIHIGEEEEQQQPKQQQKQQQQALAMLWFDDMLAREIFPLETTFKSLRDILGSEYRSFINARTPTLDHVRRKFDSENRLGAVSRGKLSNISIFELI